MADTNSDWLAYRDRDHRTRSGKWQYVADHLDGTYVDDEKIETYLHRRKQGESDEAYAERRNIVDPSMHFARAVLTLAGMAWAADPQKEMRRWGAEEGAGLGDPEVEGTIMYDLWRDADGQGTNWESVHKGATVDLIGYRRLWGLVERAPGGSARIRTLPPQAVLRVIYDGARLVSVKVETEVETAGSQEDAPRAEKRFLIFGLEGVEEYRYSDKKESELVAARSYGGEAQAGFRFTGRDGLPILPIFPVEVPLRSEVGYVMARKENALFNQENTLDFLLWVACFPKFFADVQNPVDGAFDETLWNELKQAMKKGDNLLPGKGHRFDAPPTAPAQIKQAVLQDKVVGFYRTFFQQYADAAAEKTATEIRQDFRASIEAYLTLLVGALDELENGFLWRIEQIEAPGARWGGGDPGQAFVERSTDFQPVDLDARIEQLAARALPGGRIAVDDETAFEITERYLASKGFDVPEDREAALREVVRASLERETQAGALPSAADLLRRRLTTSGTTNNDAL